MPKSIDSNHPVDPVKGQAVLVAVDFSEDSKAALIWASKYVAVTKSELVLLHVVHESSDQPGFYQQTGSGALLPHQEVAESMMSEFLAELRAECPGLEALNSLQLRFVPGLPPRRIVEVSQLLDVSLIVLGSRGITGLPHMLIGSVAERVVELSNRPVVVVKAKEPTKATKKEKKREQKRKKIELKQLQDMLGISREENSEEQTNG